MYVVIPLGVVAELGVPPTKFHEKEFASVLKDPSKENAALSQPIKLGKDKVATGGCCIVIEMLEVFVQPFAPVPVTLYETDVVGVAVTTAPVVALKPVGGAHAYVDAPLAVNVVEPAGHKLIVVALTLIFGFALIVRFTNAVSNCEQPPPIT